MSTSSASWLVQPGLPGLCGVEDALASLSTAPGEQRGAVYTRREVVDFILDLAGYTSESPLHQMRLLEPSFGGGDFLLPAIERLVSHWKAKLGGRDPMSLLPCIQAVEIHQETFETTRQRVVEFLVLREIPRGVAEVLVAQWLMQGDFLLAQLNLPFHVVVGNPPYVRQEMIPDALMTAYRARYKTIYDRADLYIPFIERSLLSLAPSGRVGFICADRWMKNRYGGPLRKLVTGGFRLNVYVDLVDTPAFHSEVSAYPAIFVISREAPGTTKIAHRPALDPISLQSLTQELLGTVSSNSEKSVREVMAMTHGEAAWVLGDNDQLSLLRRIEAEFPTLEEVGCKVGIGVATGADQAFIGDFESLDVESDRKLPLAMTRDIQSGVVKWRGKGVVNPFGDDGGLVDLNQYPRLQKYFEERRVAISGRHVALKSEKNWYRTIDRIYPSLVKKPKLLIPDIKGSAHIVFEEGKLYPHHNLYFVTSDFWDLRALQAVLMSAISGLFIGNYSTVMRGGYLRYQAQYLRKIRIPPWESVSECLRARLMEAGVARDIDLCNKIVIELYNLSPSEALILHPALEVHGAKPS